MEIVLEPLNMVLYMVQFLGMFVVLPVLSIIAMFEKKSVKYVAINAGYWVVTLAIMGGIICQWV